jgi:hypothetical protein
VDIWWRDLGMWPDNRSSSPVNRRLAVTADKEDNWDKLSNDEKVERLKAEQIDRAKAIMDIDPALLRGSTLRVYDELMRILLTAALRDLTFGPQRKSTRSKADSDTIARLMEKVGLKEDEDNG